MAGARSYGHDSNVPRGKRHMQDEDERIALIVESVESPSALSSGPKGLQVERSDDSSKEGRKKLGRADPEDWSLSRT